MNAITRLRPDTARLFGLLLALLVVPNVGRAVDKTFDLIQTKTGVYSNVTVTTTSKEYIVIQHSRGLASLKVTDLTDEVQKTLGYDPAKESFAGSLTVSANAKSLVNAISTKEIQQAWTKHTGSKMPSLNLTPNILLTVLGVFVVLYLFFCYCGSLICQKVGKPAGLLMWLPILQFIPLFRAANMTPLWTLAMFVPILNIVAHIMWSFKIANARGRGGATAILLILPTYPLAFMYLAFAGGGSVSGGEVPAKKLSLTGMTFDQA